MCLPISENFDHSQFGTRTFCQFTRQFVPNIYCNFTHHKLFKKEKENIIYPFCSFIYSCIHLCRLSCHKYSRKLGGCFFFLFTQKGLLLLLDWTKLYLNLTQNKIINYIIFQVDFVHVKALNSWTLGYPSYTVTLHQKLIILVLQNIFVFHLILQMCILLLFRIKNIFLRILNNLNTYILHSTLSTCTNTYGNTHIHIWMKYHFPAVKVNVSTSCAHFILSGHKTLCFLPIFQGFVFAFKPSVVLSGWSCQ